VNSDVPGFRRKLIDALAITTAATTNGTPITGLSGIDYVAVEAIFTYGSSGGTAAKVYVQTSLDGGTTWIDIISFAFATSTASKVSAVTTAIALAAAGTPGDGALADNTILSGLIGDQIRAKVVTTGTYVGTTLMNVYMVAKQ
jgi:hypothetical protein